MAQLRLMLTSCRFPFSKEGESFAVDFGWGFAFSLRAALFFANGNKEFRLVAG